MPVRRDARGRNAPAFRRISAFRRTRRHPSPSRLRTSSPLPRPAYPTGGLCSRTACTHRRAVCRRRSARRRAWRYSTSSPKQISARAPRISSAKRSGTGGHPTHAGGILHSGGLVGADAPPDRRIPPQHHTDPPQRAPRSGGDPSRSGGTPRPGGSRRCRAPPQRGSPPTRGGTPPEHARALRVSRESARGGGGLWSARDGRTWRKSCPARPRLRARPAVPRAPALPDPPPR